MSVTEADIMTVLGETQPSTTGSRQAEIAAAIERQADYQRNRAADFGTGRGPFGIAAADTAFALVTGSAVGAISAVRIGAPSAYGSAAGQLGGYQLSQVEGGIPRLDPQTNFPPRGGNVYRPPPGNTLPVPYEGPNNVGPWALPLGGVSVIAAGIIGAIMESDFPGIGSIPFPNSLDPEEGPYDTRAPRASPEVILSGPSVEDVFGGPTDMQGPPSMAGDNPPLPRFPTPYGGDAESSPDPNLGPVPDVVLGPPQGSRQPAPAPAPTAKRSWERWIWPVIGAVGALQLGRAGRSSPTTLFDIPLDRGTSSGALPSVSSTYQPIVASGGGFGFDTASDGCNCHKKSGKKRRCLAKAKIGWRSGPKKGKLAGTRCYRFAND